MSWRVFAERIFGKAAVVGFMLAVVRRPKPPAFEVCMISGRETLLSLIERRRYPLLMISYHHRVYGS